MDQIALPKTTGKNRAGAFSLIEILVVMAVLSILLVVAVPAFQSMVFGTNLSRAGQMIGDHLALARQEAVTKNRSTEVRFYKLPGDVTPGWRGVQIWRIEQTPTGQTQIPATRLATLPAGIVISDDNAFSPLLRADLALTGLTNVQGQADVEYRGFRFRPNGSAGSPLSASNNYLTLQRAATGEDLADNYYTVQIHPITGRVSVYRP